MKKVALVVCSLLFVCGGAQAGTRSCSAALVTAGICVNASDVLVFYSLSTTDPDGAGPRVSVATQVVEGCAIHYGYQVTIGGIANPEAKTAFCDRMLKTDYFPKLGQLYYGSLADAVRRATINATPADPVP
jgi:hypothetical protein